MSVRPPDDNSGVRAQPVNDVIVTVPNLLSFARLAGIPLFIWLLLGPHADAAAFAVLMFSAVSDWADGVLARRWQQVSRLGQVLDPLADRLYIVAILVCFLIRDIVPWWFAVGIVARDVILVFGLPLLHRRGYGPPQVNYVGKAGTMFLLVAFPLFLLSHVDADALNLDVVMPPVAWAFGIWGLALYWVAGALYARQTYDLLSKPPRPIV